jgi:hypothetical protein
MPPYISDAERERARWMTLTELTADVTKHHRGRPADQQIRNALGDRKLITMWEVARADQRRRRRPTDPPPMSHPDGVDPGPTLVPDRPPNKADFWQQARVDGDRVFDPETGRWRTLLLRRSVQQIWPEQLPAPPPPEGPRPGAPSYRDKIKENLIGVDLTNIANATRVVRQRLSDNDGKPPHDKTIRKWVKELRDKAE